MVLYNLFLLIYTLLAKCTAPFNGKVKQWVLGQEGVWDEVNRLAEKIQKPIIWVHCASYGEFEQGLPIIEKIKADYPGYQVWLTFFSPSGYLHRKNDPTVDFVTYLPMDGASNAKHFFDAVQPKLVIFIKYEFWFYYLSEAKKRNIPTLLVAAIFRPTQIFFKWYGGIYKKMLSLFYAILVQDENSKKLISPIFAFVLFSLLINSCQTSVSKKYKNIPDLTSRIDSIITKNHFNGVVLLTNKKNTLYSKVAGYSDIEKKTPLTLNNQFVIGSISKQITAVLVLIEYENGRINLDDTVANT